jgi:methyl-accepting chemotaxis protein
MLQDFRTSYSKSSASTLSSTKSFLSDVSTTTKRGYETIQTTITEMDENTNKTFDSIQSISNDNKTTCKISIKVTLLLK